MLKTKLFKCFAAVVVLFSLLTLVVGIRIIRQRVIDEAQTRVRLDLSSAWALFNNRKQDVETILRMVALKEAVVDSCARREWSDADVRNRLERIRTSFGLDFLGLADTDGKVVMRAAPPYRTGDYRMGDVAVAAALKGEPTVCVSIMSRDELQAEADGLAERAFLEIEDTPRARRSLKKEESRGMVILAAVPVMLGSRVLAVAYGGTLVNRNHDLVDQIREVVFRNEEYEGTPVGTATVFIDDARIATTVRMANGNRALGTRASKEVADRVLDNGGAWVGAAFVVKDRCLTAYEPIRDGTGQTVGMLYVGILKRPFDMIERGIILQFLYVSGFVLLFALVMAFFMAGRLAYPIHKLVEASESMSSGSKAAPVLVGGACRETESLVRAFNQMTETLGEREDRLKALNRSYMETLGFVTHELKGPVATMMNYIYLLREAKLGAVNQGQAKALKAVDAGGQRLVEMVRHYLNLSRIENGEFQPVMSRVAVLDDVLVPILDMLDTEIAASGMQVDNRIGAMVSLRADANMVREVFENLIGNALKYGRRGGSIRLQSVPRDSFIEFSVYNEGQGIPEDKLHTLFQKFSRVETGDSVPRQKGTGLGLFITRHIVEAHGGRVDVRSRSGEWAEFVFTLPAAEVASGS